MRTSCACDSIHVIKSLRGTSTIPRAAPGLFTLRLGTTGEKPFATQGTHNSIKLVRDKPVNGHRDPGRGNRTYTGRAGAVLGSPFPPRSVSSDTLREHWKLISLTMTPSVRRHFDGCDSTALLDTTIQSQVLLESSAPSSGPRLAPYVAEHEITSQEPASPI